MTKRIIFNLVLLGAIFYTPWWIATPLALYFAYRFKPFYEIFAFGVVIDLLYGTTTSAFHGTLGFLGAVLIFFLGELAARVIRPTYPLR